MKKLKSSFKAKKTRRVFFYLTLFLALMLGNVGCSNNNDNEVSTEKNEGKEAPAEKNCVHLYSRDIPYAPQELSSLPQWIIPLITTPKGELLPNCYICTGKAGEQVFYNIYADISSTTYGRFYDENGNAINIVPDEKCLDSLTCVYFK